MESTQLNGICIKYRNEIRRNFLLYIFIISLYKYQLFSPGCSIEYTISVLWSHALTPSITKAFLTKRVDSNKLPPIEKGVCLLKPVFNY